MPIRWDDANPKTISLKEKMQIIDTNLNRIDQTEGRMLERRHAHLMECVHALVGDVSDEYPEQLFAHILRDEHFPALFRELTRRTIPLSDKLLLQDEVSDYFADLCKRDRVVLCKYLAHAADRGYRVTKHERGAAWTRLLRDMVRNTYQMTDESEPDIDVKPGRVMGDKIAYLRNTYTDIAYNCFAECLQHTTATYYSDFPGVCEALFYAHVSACILPMENSSDGKLLRFYSLLDKYDLRIAYVCNVTAEDTDVTTRYALLQRDISIPRLDLLEHWTRIFMECRVVINDREGLSEVLHAASVYGLHVVGVDSVPVGYDDDDRIYDLIFDVGEDGDLAAMLVYLHLVIGQFKLFGIYPELLFDA